MKKTKKRQEKTYISLLAIKKMMINAGATRISEDAIKELRKTLENEGEKLTKQAIDIAKNSKRKTITKEDIKILKEK